jgi:hypothetical protein
MTMSRETNTVPNAGARKFSEVADDTTGTPVALGALLEDTAVELIEDPRLLAVDVV